jgi:hydroxymethylpyrimidine/phosphomethylpyrimidine kinase
VQALLPLAARPDPSALDAVCSEFDARLKKLGLTGEPHDFPRLHRTCRTHDTRSIVDAIVQDNPHAQISTSRR